MPLAISSSHAELDRTIKILRAALVDCEISHVIDLTAEPNVYTCGSVVNGYFSHGYVYGQPDGRVTFYAHDALAERRAQLEGIKEEELKCWWMPKDVDMFLDYLMGDVREAQHKVYLFNPTS